MRRVIWSGRARADLFEIVAYVRLDSPSAAYRVGSRIQRAADDLGSFSTGHPGRREGVLEKVLTPLPYIIAYRIVGPSDGAEVVTILRIIHGARDWPPGGWPEEG